MGTNREVGVGGSRAVASGPQRTVKQRWLFWKETDKESRTEDSHPLLCLWPQWIFIAFYSAQGLADLGLRLVGAGKQRI